MNIRHLSAFLFLLLGATALHAQRMEVVPTGRMLMDAALFSNHEQGLGNGLALSDVRAGLEAVWGDYSFCVEAAYGHSKFSMSDVYMERRWGKKHRIRVGNFRHHYGLHNTVSSADKVTMIPLASHTTFVESRDLGAMYVYNHGVLSAAGSLYVEKDAFKRTTDQSGNQAWGMMSRWVYRPLRLPGAIFHIGLSGAYETPRFHSDPKLNHSNFVFSNRYSTRVAQVTAQSVTVDHARALFKCTPELCMAYGRWALESQYYYNRVTRTDGHSPVAMHSGYALLRTVVLGKDYTYSERESRLADPAPGSLECVLAYDVTDLSRGELQGGCLRDLSLTFNYYLSKNMVCRLHYSHTNLKNTDLEINSRVNALQARFQVRF